MIKTIGIAAVFALVATVSTQAHAQGTPVPVQRALRAVTAEGPMVMAWVYPTVTFRSAGACRWSATDAGYNLGCTYHYTDSDGDAGYRRLVFQMDENGIIEGVRDAGGSDLWPAFASVGVAKELLAEKARQELSKGGSDDQVEQALLTFLARGPEPHQVLAFLLDVRILGG
jgi:hypothetical protein